VRFGSVVGRSPAVGNNLQVHPLAIAGSVETDELTDADGFETVESVGPETAKLLSRADISPDGLRGGDVSYRDLVDAGVDEAVAADLRREFSLPWSFEVGGDLSARSAAVGTLSSTERDWIAASADDWEDRAVTPSGPVARESADLWADRTRPIPVERVSGVGPDDADALATVGITSARQLGVASAATVANLTGRDVRQVRLWRHAARELTDRL